MQLCYLVTHILKVCFSDTVRALGPQSQQSNMKDMAKISWYLLLSYKTKTHTQQNMNYLHVSSRVLCGGLLLQASATRALSLWEDKPTNNKESNWLPMSQPLMKRICLLVVTQLFYLSWT